MSRPHFYRPILDPAGNLITDATVRVLQPGTTNLLADTLYSTPSGPETLPNPWDPTSGEIDFYLDSPQTVRIGVTQPPQIEKFFENIDVGDPGNKETFTFTVAGNAAVQIGMLRFYVEDAYVIEKVRVSAGVGPTGGDLIVDVNKNGTSLFNAANRPRVVANTNTGTSVPDVTSLAAGDYLTLDIDQIGPTTPGTSLVVQVRVRRLA